MLNLMHRTVWCLRLLSGCLPAWTVCREMIQTEKQTAALFAWFSVVAVVFNFAVIIPVLSTCSKNAETYHTCNPTLYAEE